MSYHSVKHNPKSFYYLIMNIKKVKKMTPFHGLPPLKKWKSNFSAEKYIKKLHY